jgi:hypothetical protein
MNGPPAAPGFVFIIAPEAKGKEGRWRRADGSGQNRFVSMDSDQGSIMM